MGKIIEKATPVILSTKLSFAFTEARKNKEIWAIEGFGRPWFIAGLDSDKPTGIFDIALASVPWDKNDDKITVDKLYEDLKF